MSIAGEIQGNAAATAVVSESIKEKDLEKEKLTSEQPDRWLLQLTDLREERLELLKERESLRKKEENLRKKAEQLNERHNLLLHRV